MYKQKTITAISYGDEKFGMSLKVNLMTAKYFGKADKTIAYTPADLPSDFAKRNNEILKQSRGGGYWLWKPYIILKALETCDDGEYVIYTDAGIIYVGNIKRLIAQMEKEKKSIFLSMGFAPLKHWCKRDAFELMGVSFEKTGNYPCVSGGYVLIKKSKETVDFIMQWLHYAEDKRIITDIPNTCGLPNDDGFHEHRHDQAILTLLAYQNNITPYRAVTYVDCPRSHKAVFKNKISNSSYGYSKEELVQYMKLSRQYSDGEEHRKKRIFINTHLKNTDMFHFSYELFKIVVYTIRIDLWGKKNDQRILECNIAENDKRGM